jgi:integrase
MRPARYQMNKNKYLLTHELESLRALLGKHKGERDSLLIKVTLHTGARAKEALSISRRDVDLENGTIFIKGIKGSNDREIPVDKDLVAELSTYIGTLKGDRLFPISYPRLQQVWNMYRTVNKTFHSLRHTFAIELYKRRRDIRLLQVALGHRNIMNTMVYADYIYSQDEMKKLIL